MSENATARLESEASIKGLSRSRTGIAALLPWVVPIIIFLFLTAIVPRQSAAQEVLRPGTIEMIEESVEADDDGTPFVPPLQENEGIVVLIVDRNMHFTIQDVARWLRNNDMMFIRLDADVSNARVRQDGTIRFRFTQEFIGQATSVARPVQIRHPEGHFDPFYQNLQFYKQQSVTYRMRVEREPVFPETHVPTGNLNVRINQEAATVTLFNHRGERVADRLSVNPHPAEEGFLVEFDNLPIGTYTLQASASGMMTVNQPGITVSRGETLIRNIEMAREGVVEAGKGRLILTTNLEEVELDFLFEGRREPRYIYDGMLEASLDPGRYRITGHPDGFQNFEWNLNVEAGETYEEEILFARQEPIAMLRIVSDPPGAVVEIDGQRRGTAPLTLNNLERKPTSIRLRMQRYRTHEDTLMLYTERTYTYAQRLTEGYIEVQTTPQARVSVDDGPFRHNTPFVLTDPEPREYRLQIRQVHYAPIDTVIDMTGRDVFRLRENLYRPSSTVTLNPVNPPVPVDIELTSSMTSLTRNREAQPVLELAYNDYELRFRRPGFHTLNETVRINQPEQIVNYELVPKSKFGGFVRSMFFPGAGQWYWGNNSRGTLIFFAFFGVAGYTGYEFYEYLNLEDRYEQAVIDYRRAQTVPEINRTREQMIAYRKDMMDKRDDLDLFLQIAAGIYAVNLIDRLLVRSPRRIYRREAGSGMGMQLEGTPNGVRLTLDF